MVVGCTPQQRWASKSMVQSWYWMDHSHLSPTWSKHFLHHFFSLACWRTEGGDRRGGGVNGSQIKFFYKYRPMSQVKSLEPKHYKKMMNTPSNIIELIPSKLWTQWKKEWDQLDTRLARYGQNREQTSGRQSQSDNVRDFQIKSGRTGQNQVGGLGSRFFFPKSASSFQNLILEL
jgi:hypothetical protein